MSILTTTDLALSFGAFDVFHSISVRIPEDGKIGLIGPNGIGKTSLLLILAGLSQPTAGSVQHARGRRLGYLRQESIEAFAARDNLVMAEMQAVFAHLQSQETRLHEMEAAMESGDFDETLLAEYGILQDAFAHAGGYDYEVRIQRTLQGLGLDKSTWDMPVSHLSGGQQTRALLARLLLEQPDLLILDEPTNHLDVEAIEWLEKTLREWPGAVLIVSHDRYFLDSVVNTIWEMSRSGMEVYSGNYSAYLRQRQERWEWQRKVFYEEKARLEKELTFIERNIVRASSNARAVGMLRRLSRDLEIVQHFGVVALRSGKSWHETGLDNPGPIGVAEAGRIIRSLAEPGDRPPRLNLRLEIPHHSGQKVLQSAKLKIGYPGNLLFSAAELELERGECAALIGPNGAGKTTFLKTLLEQMEPLSGKLHFGHGVRVGYFAQAHETLRPQDTVIEALQRSREIYTAQARNHLAQYLFRGDDVFKPVSALSGGERGRLALAILALQGANFLLLDEPSNHLDIPAQEVLQEVLERFQGTILLVSHDRYLVDRLATQIWELRGGRLQVFKGTYRELLEQRAAGTAPQQAVSGKPKVQGVRSAQAPARLNRELAALEERIARQEASLQRLSQELQSAGQAQSFDQVHSLSWKYARAQADLEKLLAQWEELSLGQEDPPPARAILAAQA